MLNDHRLRNTFRALYHVQTHWTNCVFKMCSNDFKVWCQFNLIVGSGACNAMSSASIYVTVLRKYYILIVDGFNGENRSERATLKRKCHLDDKFSHRKLALKITILGAIKEKNFVNMKYRFSINCIVICDGYLVQLCGNIFLTLNDVDNWTIVQNIKCIYEL